MDTNEKIESLSQKYKEKELKDLHYYGDRVRIVFVIMALIMLVMTPIVKDEIPFPLYTAVFGILSLSMLAGFLRPRLTSIIAFSFLTSLVALAIFGYETIVSYQGSSIGIFFIGNTVLSVLSFVALYFSSKTLRGDLFAQH